MEPARDPFEELTSLYLGEPTPAPRGGSTSAPTRRSRVEPMRITVAVCGNLPVMAGIWVTQYADLEAARSGPTALVRLDGGRCSFELLRPAHDPVRVDGESMPEAAAALAGDIRRWIVCVDDRDAAAAVRAGADELVVLTSADQLALVEAYRLVKAARARAVDPETLDLGVVIAGANENTADRAAAVLEEMSMRHLGAPLPVIALVRRLDVVEHSHRIAFEESLRGDAAEMVTALRSVTVSDTDAESPSGSPVDREITADDDRSPRLRLAEADTDLDLESLLGRLDAVESELELEVDPDLLEFDAIFGGPDDDGGEIETEPGQVDESHEPREAERAGRHIDRTRQRPRLPSPIRLGPSPSQAADRPAFIDLDELDRSSGDAASRIGPGRGDLDPAASAGVVEPKPVRPSLLSVVSGLREVDWPFVTAEGVRCGVDAEGRLHLICRDLDHGRLEVARRWAFGQRRALATVAGVTEQAVAEPVLHVVTDHPPRVADLHRTGVHLHLLVESEGRWTSIPLNDDQTRDMS